MPDSPASPRTPHAPSIDALVDLLRGQGIAWVWEAHYSDGSVQAEFTQDDGPDGPVYDHGFHEIDLPRCTSFHLISIVPGLPDHHLHVDPASGQRPIFFRRDVQQQHFSQATANEDGSVNVPTDRYKLHCLGWQRTIRGRNVKALTYYYPNGASVVTDDDHLV